MSGMDDLSIELLARIIHKGQFSPLQTCSLSLLSREWREASSLPSVWKSLELRVPEYSENALLSIAKYCTELEELHISRDPHNPRPLTMMSCGEWLDGVESILLSSQKNLKRLVVSTGCNSYQKDYRSSSFYMHFMRKVARISNQLEECDIYYNVGKCIFGRDISHWFADFLRGCPKIKKFTLWSPCGDCGGMGNSALENIAQGWEDIESLELSGEDITLDGIFILRTCENLKYLKLQNVSLGSAKRPQTIHNYSSLEEHYLACSSLEFRVSSPLEELVLVSSHCDSLDLKLISRTFRNLKSIKVIENLKHREMVELGDDSDSSPVATSQPPFDYENLKNSCLEDDELRKIVSFAPL